MLARLKEQFIFPPFVMEFDDQPECPWEAGKKLNW